MTTFFRSLDEAVSVQSQVSYDDPEWLYRIFQTQNPIPTWIIEIRDEDGVLIGSL